MDLTKVDMVANMATFFASGVLWRSSFLGVDAWLSGPIPVHTFFYKVHTPEILHPHPPNARHPNSFLIHPSNYGFSNSMAGMHTGRWMALDRVDHDD